MTTDDSSPEISDDALGADSRRAIRELADLIASSDDPFLLADLDGTILHANAAAVDLVDLVSHVRRQMPREILDSPGTRWRGDVALEQDSETRTFDVQVLRGTESLAIHARDISSSTRLHEHLSHLATHDTLTDLPNRAHLIRRLATAIERSRVRGAGVMVLYVDIDDLKQVNDSVGHERGDALIVEIGRRLVAATRPGDLVGRIGGDEFVVVCEGVNDERSALDIAERLRSAASAPTMRSDVDTGVSIGVVMFSDGDRAQSAGVSAESLLRDADSAMYLAKAKGKARCEIYTEGMRTAERRRLRLSNDLDAAVDSGQLFLVHQPIVSPHTNRVVAAEALVRWNHPEYGLVQPSSFISLADESGVGGFIGKWILSQALRDLRQWIDSRRVDPHFRIHVNVSSSHIRTPNFTDSVVEALASTGLRNEQLVLEFRETVLLLDDGRVLRALQSLRRRGVLLSLDDFGSGTSSLTILRTCPLDYVKLDGSLVSGIGTADHEEPALRGLIQLAHGFDTTVIAESVSNPVHVERLVALGCDLVQGFHIGQPVPAAEFATGTATVSEA